MNLAGHEDPESSLLFANFNQDCSSIAVGTKSGYKLYTMHTTDKLENIYETESLYIHNIRDMKVLHTIRDTPPNPQGFCALSINSENCYLAYPGSNQIGEVQIFDCSNLKAVTMIPAHDNPIAALTFSPPGTKIATASEKGTVIRVFSVPDGVKLFEFRRGVKRCVTIYSLAFSPDSLYLVSSSNTETVHVFKLEAPKEGAAAKQDESQQSWMGYVGQALKSSASYLPSQVSDMLNQGRDHATARLPFSGLRNVSTIVNIQREPRVMIAAQDGYLYIYDLDDGEGGECNLLKRHRLDGRPDPAQGDISAEQAKDAMNSETGDGPLSGAVGAESQERGTIAEGESALANLRLDDENEFPPMTHTTDD